jgi:hypothetical protein
MKNMKNKITASILFLCFIIGINASMAAPIKQTSLINSNGFEMSQGTESTSDAKDRKMKKKKKKKNRHLCSAYSY